MDQTRTIEIPVTDTRAVVVASAVGTIMEWYDFALYGAAAALFINRLYFPNVSPTIGSLAAFATFAAGSWRVRWAASWWRITETASAASRR